MRYRRVGPTLLKYYWSMERIPATEMRSITRYMRALHRTLCPSITTCFRRDRLTSPRGCAAKTPVPHHMLASPQPYLSAQEWDHWETAQVLIAAMGNKYVKLKPDTFPRPPGRLPKTGELTNPDPEEEEERDGWGSVVDDSSYEKGKFDLDDSDEGAQGVNEVLGNGGGGGDGDGAEEEAEVEEEDD